MKDENFPEQYFEVVQGALSVRWARLGPGANVTHVVVLRPLSAGLFNFTAAQISYKAAEEDKETQVRGVMAAFESLFFIRVERKKTKASTGSMLQGL